MKLVQRKFLKGSREFEIIEDTVEMRIKSAMKEEKLSVVLAILNPEPIVNPPFLEFHSRVRCGPLLSLFIDNPDSASFNAFVDTLKRRARESYGSFTGLKTATAGLPGNSFEEPPEFGEPRKPQVSGKPVRVESIESSIQMLRQHLDADEIAPLLDAMESLKSDPHSEAAFAQLVNSFDSLGGSQGAVLTYAPYLSILLSDDPFEYQGKNQG